MSEQKTEECKCFVGVRVRGTVSAMREARETLVLPRLTQHNEAHITHGKVAYSKLPDSEARFKLHPPSKGYKGQTKNAFKAGGEAGYRGAAINDLVKRMV